MTPALGRALLTRALARPGHLHDGARLVCVDGPAGSGKTTAAAALEAEARATGLAVAVVHMDDLYPGWDGLPRLHEHTVPLVAGLAAAGTGTYHRWDWASGAYAEEHVVAAGDLVVLEGVGAADPAYADRTTLTVLVTAPEDLRLRRGLERDGDGLRAEWLAWLEAERAHLAVTGPAERADVVVDGVTGDLAAGR